MPSLLPQEVESEISEIFRVLYEVAQDQVALNTDRGAEDAGLIYGMAAFVATSLEKFSPSAKSFAQWARERKILASDKPTFSGNVIQGKFGGN